MVLPEPLGPFHVSYGDFELRRSKAPAEPSAGNGGHGHHVHPPLFRVYYPTDGNAEERREVERSAWLPHVAYLYGYICSMIPPFSFFASILTWLLSRITYLLIKPYAAIRCLPARPFISPASLLRHLTHHHADPTTSGGENPEGRLPVVLFSHGLWSMRSTYTQFCFDLASHGYVVVAPEYTDGSACMAAETDGEEEEEEGGGRGGGKGGKVKWIPHERMDVDFFEVPMEVRHRQLQQRMAALRSILTLLHQFNKGHVSDSRNAITTAARLLPSSLARRLDLSHIALAGHSFGGATAAFLAGVAEQPINGFHLSLSPAAHGGRSDGDGDRDGDGSEGSLVSRVSSVVVLDTWWRPLPDEAIALAGGKAALLCIDTEGLNAARNVVARKRFLKGRLLSWRDRWLRIVTEQAQQDGEVEAKGVEGKGVGTEEEKKGSGRRDGETESVTELIVLVVSGITYTSPEPLSLPLLPPFLPQPFPLSLPVFLPPSINLFLSPSPPPSFTPFLIPSLPPFLDPSHPSLPSLPLSDAMPHVIPPVDLSPQPPSVRARQGSAHQDPSDLALVAPAMMKHAKMAGAIPPPIFHRINSGAALRFLHQNFPPAKKYGLPVPPTLAEDAVHIQHVHVPDYVKDLDQIAVPH
ncbi:unnamed protein product [Closterium sp. NIES-54]